jgi:steroid 5-alpha reductase family enzyme
MWDVSTYLGGLAALIVLVTIVWVVSLILRDASIIDPFWSLLFLVAVVTYALLSDAPGGGRRPLIVVLVALWAIRLAGYLFWRAWGEEEDYRYQAMRRKAGASFPVRSLFTVFWLQGVLAWIVSLPLLAAVDGSRPLGWLDWLGLAVFAVGWVFETGADWQLARFKADPANRGQVMDRGFWRYTRHPNYFGNFTMWWSFYLVAVSAGGWWSIIGPLVMSFLLLRVSGVAMLEKTIGTRRPGYEEYVRRTNAFFPGPRRA